MQVALFIPCYVNAVFPEVGMASLHLLQQLGVDVVYPKDKPAVDSPWAMRALNKRHAT